MDPLSSLCLFVHMALLFFLLSHPPGTPLAPLESLAGSAPEANNVQSDIRCLSRPGPCETQPSRHPIDSLHDRQHLGSHYDPTNLSDNQRPAVRSRSHLGYTHLKALDIQKYNGGGLDPYNLQNGARRRIPELRLMWPYLWKEQAVCLYRRMRLTGPSKVTHRRQSYRSQRREGAPRPHRDRTEYRQNEYQLHGIEQITRAGTQWATPTFCAAGVPRSGPKFLVQIISRSEERRVGKECRSR